MTCPSCGAEVTLSSQQVVCEYCGARIQTDFYDWQTEVFEIYEHIGNNLRKFLLLLGCMMVLFLSEFLCLYLIRIPRYPWRQVWARRFWCSRH